MSRPPLTPRDIAAVYRACLNMACGDEGKARGGLEAYLRGWEEGTKQERDREREERDAPRTT